MASVSEAGTTFTIVLPAILADRADCDGKQHHDGGCDKTALGFTAACGDLADVRGHRGELCPGQVSPESPRRRCFPSFNPNVPACSTPPDLKKVLAFAQDNRARVHAGRRPRPRRRCRIAVLTIRSRSPTTMRPRSVNRSTELREAQVGGVVAAPVDPASLAPQPAAAHLGRRLCRHRGAAARDVAAQRAAVSDRQGAGRRRRRLHQGATGGRANVVLLTHDSLQFLAPRFVAMRDALQGNARRDDRRRHLAADREQGRRAATMQTILLAHPDVDVVLGADTVVLGALAALRAAGKARPTSSSAASTASRKPSPKSRKAGPYKASISLASPVFGYAMGQHAADWLEGKSIPQAMDILPSRADDRQHRAVRGRSCRSGDGLGRSGAADGVSQDVRQHLLRHPRPYVNFPWSSERKVSAIETGKPRVRSGRGRRAFGSWLRREFCLHSPP